MELPLVHLRLFVDGKLSNSAFDCCLKDAVFIEELAT
jgi:hypothetical protein